ncbi:TGF-beta-inducible nuclear protein 1, partial [Paragonimus heterotremus]
ICLYQAKCFRLTNLFELIPENVTFPPLDYSSQGKWEVPLPKVRSIAESEAFKIVRTGKSKRKAWKRMVTKMCFVGDTFTRKPPKFERFIRPMGLRVRKANVTHPELKATFQLPIIGVKKNPSSPMYTSLGVITKGTVIEVSYFFDQYLQGID